LEHAIRAAKVYDADALVRVSRGGYSDYIRPLELDAAGIMVPHLMSAADARSVARMTRFHPVGRRPVDGGNADGAYCRIDFNSYLEQANRERFVIVQIEDPEPMAELEAIAAVLGIDMLFFGPGDFSHGIGKPGQWDAPEIAAARKSIALAARKHGKFAGTVSDAAGIRERLDLGYRFISVGADVVALEQYWDDVAKAFSDNGFGK
jgi:4-hydroxy-2-oxoheptanedioate aldolase